MLDRKFIVENAELVEQNCVNRGVKADVHRFVNWNRPAGSCRSRWKSTTARRTRSPSRSARRKTRPSARPARKRGGCCGKRRADAPGESRRNGRRAGDACTGTIPNLSHPDAPIGVGRQVEPGTVPRQNAAAQVRSSSRWTTCSLAEKLDLVDFEGGARVAGHGFYFLKNEAVLLELALQRYALEMLLGEGFTPDDHARPGPQRHSRRASASFPAGRRRKSTASRTAT